MSDLDSDLDKLELDAAARAALSRRGLLGRGLPIAAVLAGLQWVPRVVLARGQPSQRDLFVHLFLRGGMDGLSTFVPYGDPELYLARPTIAIPPPGNQDGAIDLDGFFGLAPAAAPLLTPYQAGKLAIVQAAGSTDHGRSHFEAYKFMEFGIPGQPGSSIGSGWLARHLHHTAPTLPDAPLRGVAVSSVMPYTLLGSPSTLAIPDLDHFSFVGGSTAPQRRALIERSYASTPEPLKGVAESTFASLDLLDTIDFAGYVPANGAVYPDSFLGRGMKSASALIKANVGVECLMLDASGWDLHAKLATRMPMLLDDLSRTMLAFYLDHFDSLDKITMLVMSEFGRRVEENSSAGADHGHGNCLMVMGGHVAGGQVFANWPGLQPSALDDGDLQVTTDYRDIVAEILVKRMEEQDIADVFPNYTPTFQGIII